MIKIVEPSVEILSDLDYDTILKGIEQAGRTCYKSDSPYTRETGERFVRMLINNGHKSVLEHEIVRVRFIGSRSMSHQLVRHRLASYSQESQRYCNYNKNDELEVILPKSIDTEEKFNLWQFPVHTSYNYYKKMVGIGIKPEDARSVLPNCTKTEVVTTMNLAQWRYFFEIRTDIHAQEEIRTLANTLLGALKEELPSIFTGIPVTS